MSNIYNYDCSECGLWGDLLLGYGVLKGREKILGVDSNVLRRDKDFILEVYLREGGLRKKRSELMGIEFCLEETNTFDDLSLTLMSKISSCSDCQKIYQKHYRNGLDMATTSLSK